MPCLAQQFISRFSYITLSVDASEWQNFMNIVDQKEPLMHLPILGLIACKQFASKCLEIARAAVMDSVSIIWRLLQNGGPIVSVSKFKPVPI